MEKNLKLSTYVIFFIGLFLLLQLHLMTALIGGISMYIIVNELNEFIKTKIHSKTSKYITILILSGLIFALLFAIFSGIYSALTVGKDNYANMGVTIISTLEVLKSYLPEALHVYLPENFNEIKEQSLEMIKKSLPDVLVVSKNITLGFFHILVGMFIGSLVAFSKIGVESVSVEKMPFFKLEMTKRVNLFVSIFHKVVFAQVKISAINTVLTGIYLLLILPIFNIKIPYATTLVVLTFLLGLLPVVGNLISNTFITLLSLKISFSVALYSLLFLVVVHKLEYYVNAKIIGAQIETKIWEMLLVILLFESAFGIVGAVLSPVIYGYIKEELKQNKLI